MLSRKILYTAIPALAMLLASCSDKHEYIPGEPDDPNCMGVYFDAANETDFIFIPGEKSAIDVTLHRLKTDEAADVPLIGTSSVNGVLFPQSVHFDAGSADATVAIDCSDMPIRTPAVIGLDLPSEYVNHYTATLFNYQANALVSQWESANTDGSPVKVYFTDTDYISSLTNKIKEAVYRPVEHEMEVLPGAGLIRLKNFINTGVDMTFRLTPSPMPDYLGLYRVSPVGHAISLELIYESDAYGDSWFNAWFLMIEKDVDLADYVGEEDEEEEDESDDKGFAEANLFRLDDGGESLLTYPYFFWYSNDYAQEYAYANLKSTTRSFNCVSIGLAGTPDDDLVTFPSYFYIYFRWDGETGL